jgi:hypothetical protein
MNDVGEEDKKNLLRLQKIQQESRLELVKGDMQSLPKLEELFDLEGLKSTYIFRRPKVTYH